MAKSEGNSFVRNLKIFLSAPLMYLTYLLFIIGTGYSIVAAIVGIISYHFGGGPKVESIFRTREFDKLILTESAEHIYSDQWGWTFLGLVGIIVIIGILRGLSQAPILSVLLAAVLGAGVYGLLLGTDTIEIVWSSHGLDRSLMQPLVTLGGFVAVVFAVVKLFKHIEGFRMGIGGALVMLIMYLALTPIVIFAMQNIVNTLVILVAGILFLVAVFLGYKILSFIIGGLLGASGGSFASGGGASGGKPQMSKAERKARERISELERTNASRQKNIKADAFGVNKKSALNAMEKDAKEIEFWKRKL